VRSRDHTTPRHHLHRGCGRKVTRSETTPQHPRATGLDEGSHGASGTPTSTAARHTASPAYTTQLRHGSAAGRPPPEGEDDHPPSHSPPGWEEAAPWLPQHGHGACQPDGQAPVETDSKTRGGGLHLQKSPPGCTPRGEQAASHGCHLQAREMPTCTGATGRWTGRRRPANRPAPRRQSTTPGRTRHHQAPRKKHTRRAHAEGKPEGIHPSDPNWPDPAARTAADKPAADRS
jgi:hypothetical protein